MEPISGAIVAAGKAAKAADESKLMHRLIGPLFDEIGLNLLQGYRQRNALKIAEKAARRVGSEALLEDGCVHPRVAQRVLGDGSYAHEEVMQEYLAGLLSGSRTAEGSDDRAAYYVNLVASLPANHVRLHHAIYDALATSESTSSFANGSELRRNTVVTPLASAAAAIVVPANVDESDALGESLLGLYREGLVSSYGLSKRSMLRLGASDELVMMAQPSTVGCFLALWAHGLRDSDVERFSRIVPCDYDEPGPTFDVHRLIDPQEVFSHSDEDLLWFPSHRNADETG